MEHRSVLLEEVVIAADLGRSQIVVDATLGLGGHARKILENPQVSRLIGFEQDRENLREAQKILAKFSDKVSYVQDNFRFLKTRVTGLGIEKVDVVIFDLGLSSPHVDDPRRGFSFIHDGPLDMRFNRDEGITAAEVINTYSQDELARIFREYGEERYAKKLARDLVKERVQQKITTTAVLADFIARHKPQKYGASGIRRNPATQVFQALRIEVNDELDALREGVEQAVELLAVGGRVLIISYHSLEDRLVKHYFKDLLRPPAKNAEQSLYRVHDDPYFFQITRKPVIPRVKEIEENPRSRSAKLRVYEKLRELDN